MRRVAFGQCTTPHGDVVLFAAGKIGEGAGVFVVGDSAEIALQAVFESDTGFGGSLNKNGFRPFVFDEKFHDRRRIIRRDENIDVMNRFLGSAITARCFSAKAIGVRFQRFENHFDGSCDIAESEKLSIGFAKLDCF